MGGLLKTRYPVVLIALMILQLQVYSQHISRDNYKGKWESAQSWDPSWQTPETDSLREGVVINGYITADKSISFSNRIISLEVNDTLVIKGDLFMSSRNGLSVGNNGILVILGSLTIGNQTTIEADGYLVIMKDVVKRGSVMQGFALSNDDPVKVFIGGALPDHLADDVLYTIFDKIDPQTSAYQNSGAAFGNMDDIRDDAIFAFFESLLEPEDDEVFVPNVITPNNDGVNDNLVIKGLGDNARLTVFNRWGGLELDIRGYSNDWDGRNNRGQELPEDTYFFILDNGNGLVRKGSVLILR